MTRTNGRLIIIVALLAALMLLGAVNARAASAEEAVQFQAIYGADNPVPDIAKNVRPAVVQVISMVESWTPQGGVQTTDAGFGSGVYFDERGFILTNLHVIDGADRVEVKLLSGERILCDVQGTDSGTDIAILKALEPIDATPVPLGDSDALQIGELAIAIGNPASSETSVLFGTVTVGIISGLDRKNVNAQNFTRRVNVIQTDAAINNGSSGGALLNAKGELIGITTLKLMFGYDTVYEGLGFAIPISKGKDVINQLIETGKVVRPRLGIRVDTIEGPEEPLRFYPPAGARVVAVEPAGAAGKAGVMLFDIIMAVNGVRIKSSDELIAETEKYNAGDELNVSVYRCFNLIDGSLLNNPETLELVIELRLLD